MECQNCGSTDGPFVGCWEDCPPDEESDDQSVVQLCEPCAMNLGYCSCCGGYYGDARSLLDCEGSCPRCKQDLIDAKYECGGEKSDV